MFLPAGSRLANEFPHFRNSENVTGVASCIRIMCNCKTWPHSHLQFSAMSRNYCRYVKKDNSL